MLAWPENLLWSGPEPASLGLVSIGGLFVFRGWARMKRPQARRTVSPGALRADLGM